VAVRSRKERTMRTAATIRTTVKLAVSALAVAAAGMTLAPLSALAATAPAGTSVSFTVLAPAVTSNGGGGVLTVTRTALTVIYSTL
jgi:hypothetical protein